MNHIEHILIFTPGFAADEGDENCIPPLQLYVRTLAEQYSHLKITVVSLHYPYRRGPRTWHGIDVYDLGGANRSGWRKPLVWVRALKQLRQIHRRQPVTVIHSFWIGEVTWLAQKFARRNRIHHVATLQGQDALPGNRYLRRIDISSVRVVAISRRASEIFEVTLKRGKAMDINPWGIAEEDLRELPMTRSIDVLGVGNLVEVKNYELWLEVVAEVVRQRSNVRAVLIGEGPERSRLERRMNELGLGNHVEIRGAQPRQQVLEAMRQARVFLHTANYEGQGYVFNEALAQGMTLVSTPVGAAWRSAHWLTGDDIVALARAVLEQLNTNDPPERRVPVTMMDTVRKYVGIYAER